MSTLPGKHYFEQRQRNRLYETVIQAVEDAARLDGVRRKDIAEAVGSSPSQISRWLSGPSNWTIDNVTDVLWAIGGELDYNFFRFVDRVQENRSHPINDIDLEKSAPVLTLEDASVNRMIVPDALTKANNNVKVSITRE